MRPLMLPLLLVGCDTTSALSGTDATLCVEADLDADDRLAVEVTLECISGSAHDLLLACEVTTEGDVVTLSASWSYDLPNEVTLDCNQHVAQCGSDVLAAGSYTLTDGSLTHEVILPAPAGGVETLCFVPGATEVEVSVTETF